MLIYVNLDETNPDPQKTQSDKIYTKRNGQSE